MLLLEDEAPIARSLELMLKSEDYLVDLTDMSKSGLPNPS